MSTRTLYSTKYRLCGEHSTLQNTVKCGELERSEAEQETVTTGTYSLVSNCLQHNWSQQLHP